jgi:hypothetical protein
MTIRGTDEIFLTTKHTKHTKKGFQNLKTKDFSMFCVFRVFSGHKSFNKGYGHVFQISGISLSRTVPYLPGLSW